MGNLINGHIIPHIVGSSPVEQFEMYQMMAIVLSSNLSCISVEKVFEALSGYDYVMPKTDRMKFTVNSFLTFPPSGRVNACDEVWIAQRNDNQRLDAFENFSYGMTRGVFLYP